MGSIMLHYFLQQQSSEWKEKHIRELVLVEVKVELAVKVRVTLKVKEKVMLVDYSAL